MNDNPHRPWWRRPRARVAAWMGAVGLMLLVPLAAMQVTPEVRWTGEDFIFAAMLLLGTGAGIELAVQRASGCWYRAGAATAILSALVLVWSNHAVGVIGPEGNPANRIFDALPVLALLGGAAVRFRAHGMAVVMAALAAGQLALGLMAWAGGGGLDVVPVMVFAVLWGTCAALFARAAREENNGLVTPPG